MKVIAKLNNLRIAPRKVRLVADLIRGKESGKAREILNFTLGKSSHPFLKLLESGLANAKNSFQIEPENLYISKLTVDEGQKLKRWMPRARGSAYEIQKKTSHITLVLDEIKPGGVVKKEQVAGEKELEVKGADGSVKQVKDIKKNKQIKGMEMPRPKNTKAFKRIFNRKAI
jgi:large subunit ribosomal protein L22